MEIRRYLSIVRRRILLVVAILAAALAAGWLITPRDHTYTATSTLYVGSRSIDINPTSGEVSGDRVQGLDRLIATFTEMVASRPIADAALGKVAVPRTTDRVVAQTSAEQVPKTNLIRVSVTDAGPAVARDLANAMSAALVDQIRNFEPRETQTQTDQVLSVYDQARLPTVPNPSGLLRNLVLAGLFGLIVAGSLVALLEYLDITLRSADDAEHELELPVLGVVPALSRHLPITPAVNVRPPPSAPRPPTSQQGAPVG